MGRSKKARKCPRCGSKDILLQDSLDDGADVYVCSDCDFEFEVGGRGSRRFDDDFDSDGEFDTEVTEEQW